MCREYTNDLYENPDEMRVLESSSLNSSKLAALDNPNFDRLQATPEQKTPPDGPQKDNASGPALGVGADSLDNVHTEMSEHSKSNTRQDTVTNRENIDSVLYAEVQKKPKGDNLKAGKAQPLEAVSGTSVAGKFSFFW